VTTYAPYTYNAVVHRVIDGDTIVANVDLGFGMWRMAQTFRLLGINAREHNQVGGKEATAHLEALLPHGTPVLLRSVKADKYGNRFDATVQLTVGTDLSSILIQTQWAAAWDGHGERPLPEWPRP
jgi:endonuclease YncB( thermonuclease family)